jgi:hypothetical protein
MSVPQAVQVAPPLEGALQWVLALGQHIPVLMVKVV